MADNLSNKQVAEVRRLWKRDLDDLEDMIAGETHAKSRRSVAFQWRYSEKPKGRGFKGKGRGYLATVRGRAFQRTTATSFAERTARRFKKILCRDLRYCERSKSEGLALAISVADALVMVAVIPVPITAISVYLVRRGILDRVCQCKKKRK